MTQSEPKETMPEEQAEEQTTPDMEEDMQQTSADSEQAQDPAEIKITALEEELAKTKDHLLRTLADAENTRKRAQRDVEDSSKYAVTGFARDLLDFADNFKRALDAIPADIKADEQIKGVVAGIAAMEQELLRTFERHGIKKMEPEEGQPFNPNFHEVMFEAPVPGQPAGSIFQVLEPGYMLHDRLLRAARVGVAKDDGSAAPPHHIDTEA